MAGPAVGSAFFNQLKYSRDSGIVENMAVPKQKHTKSRRNRRRMHIFLQAPVLGVCQRCKKAVLSHTVCRNCGYYKDVQVIDVMKKLDRKEKKQKEKELAEQEEAQKPSAGEGQLSWEEMSKK